MKNLPPKQKILIVDDMPTNLEILGEAFSGDYEVFVAATGERGLDLALRNRPDLILMDVIMPGMNGFDVCRRLKENETTKNIPLIFITSKSERTDEERGLSLGAADYVTKPFHLPVVKARVKTQLDLKRKTDLLENLASHDGLTDLPNRRSFDERFETEWRRAVRDGGALGLILMDIDYFKNFNDHYGHSVGDDCLRQAARCIAGSLKRAGDFAARYGGEEFVVLISGTTADELGTIAERIRVGLEDLKIPHAYSPVASHVTISLGSACQAPREGDSPRDFLDYTDSLLYRAKETGRNRVVLEGRPPEEPGIQT